MASACTHLMTGFAVGVSCDSLPTAVATGMASHIVFDVLPHHDYERTSAHALDMAVGVIGVGLLASRIAALGISPLRGLGGAIGALLPDLEHVPELVGMRSRSRRLFPSHRVHWPHLQVRLATGIAMGVALAGMSWIHSMTVARRRQATITAIARGSRSFTAGPV